MKHLILLLLCLCIPGMVFSQLILDEPLSPRITNYKMDVTLDTEAKTVSGTTLVSWRNTSDQAVDNLQFHLYLNAFRSNHASMYIGGTGGPAYDEMGFGWCDVHQILDPEGNDLAYDMEYIQPIDGNKYDKTVLKVPLRKAVKPGETITVEVDFTSKLPTTFQRTGYRDDYFFVAQWFPKLGVFENGDWSCHQFIAGEFYSNHSLYEVDLTLPEEYVVGSGGVTLSQEVEEDMKTLHIRAEDIVDFAWTAWPDYEVVEDQWEHVHIRMMMDPAHMDQADRYLTSLKYALTYFKEHMGPYPWPHVTLVDPPLKGMGASGMEYTTLFTAGTSSGLPKGIRAAEMVTVHEFGHAYLMGILATNEATEPWMDEGMNSYYEQRIMDHYYGPNMGMVQLGPVAISDKETGRSSYTGSALRKIGSNAMKSWEFPHGSYGVISYQKAATWLHSLEGLIGTAVMDSVFTTYYDRWAFKHPNTQDFIDIVNEVVAKHHGDSLGADMNWFFDQVLYGTDICDFRVHNVYSRKVKGFRGMVKDGDSLVLRTEEGPDSLYISRVQLQRTGEIRMPVEILIHFDNGDEIREYWDGKNRTKDYEYIRKERVSWVKIDPEFKNPLDVNLLNNSFTLTPDTKPLKKFKNNYWFLFQNLIQFLSF